MADTNAKLAVLIATSVGLIGLGITSALLFMPVKSEQSDPAARPATAPTVAPVGPISAAEPTPTELAMFEPVAPRQPPNRLARDLEREQIWKALGRKHSLKPAAPGSAAPSESAAAQLPELDENYVGNAIKEQLLPVALDCYNTGRTKNREIAGRLEFAFTIIGDEEVGGVVEEVSLTDESTLDDAFVRECLIESLMAVTFPPPPGGGRVEVIYPLTFEPDD